MLLRVGENVSFCTTRGRKLGGCGAVDLGCGKPEDMSWRLTFLGGVGGGRRLVIRKIGNIGKAPFGESCEGERDLCRRDIVVLRVASVFVRGNGIEFVVSAEALHSGSNYVTAGCVSGMGEIERERMRVSKWKDVCSSSPLDR